MDKDVEFMLMWCGDRYGAGFVGVLRGLYGRDKITAARPWKLAHRLMEDVSTRLIAFMALVAAWSMRQISGWIGADWKGA